MVPVWRYTLPHQIAALAEMVLGACANARRDPNHQFRDRCPQDDASQVEEQRPPIFCASLCVSAVLADSPLQSSVVGDAEFTYNSCVIDVPAFQNVGEGSGAA